MRERDDSISISNTQFPAAATIAYFSIFSHPGCSIFLSHMLAIEDVILYAKQLGIDPSSEPDLLWIAKKGLLANLPSPWIAM